MSRADGVLVVVLKRRPFEDIRDGIKLEEYRGANWAKRLLTELCWDLHWVPNPSRPGRVAKYIPRQDYDFHPYHTLRAYLGYAKDRPMLERKITGIRWGMPNPAWTYGIVPDGPCFIIELEKT